MSTPKDLTLLYSRDRLLRGLCHLRSENGILSVIRQKIPKPSKTQSSSTCLQSVSSHASHRPNRQTRFAFSTKGSIVYATAHTVILYSVGGSDCQTEWEGGSKWQYYHLFMCTFECESLYLYIKQQVASARH